MLNARYSLSKTSGKLVTIAAMAVLLVCLALLPAPAFAAETISKVTINEIVQPGIDAEPSYTGVIPETDNYEINEFTSNDYKIGWIETKGKPTQTDLDYKNRSYAVTEYTDVHIEKFKKGLYYTVIISVSAKDGFVFKTGVSATLNGKKSPGQSVGRILYRSVLHLQPCNYF